MAHWAEIDDNNIVVRVTVGSNDEPDEGYQWLIDNLGGTWIQTSYNANFRGNFAATGYTYDEGFDAFIPPKPYDSWLLDEEAYNWVAPVPHPADGEKYFWNEEAGDWEPVSEA